MSSAVAELETGLQAMLALKPPGVSGTRINALTAICVNNVQSESVLVQKIFTHFKKTPGTHKLGVLYVVDSVTRRWIEQAKSQGQPASAAAPDGTFAAGVHRMTELVPLMMNDIISTAPESQKEKIHKLIEIWEKGQTFPQPMITSFRGKLSSGRPQNVSTTTPPGSPPANPLGGASSAGAGTGAAAASSASNSSVSDAIMAVLANITRQNATTAQNTPSLVATAPPALAGPSPAPAPALAHTPTPAPAISHNAAAPASVLAPSLSSLLAAAGVPSSNPPGNPTNPVLQPGQAQMAAQAPHLGMPFMQPPVNAPAALPYGYHMPTQPGPASGNHANGFTNGSVPPPAAAPHQIVQLVAALTAQGVPLDKIASIVQMMGQAGGGPALGAAPGAAPLPPPPPPGQLGYGMPQVPNAGPQAGPSPWDMPRPDESRDRNGLYGRPHGRSRSRSPQRRFDGHGASPHGGGRDGDRGGFRHEDPYGRGRSMDRDLDRGGPARQYRERSPHHRAPSPPVIDPDSPPLERWIEFDPALPTGCIRVYSRTLFVGGVACPENELHAIFSRFGEVQTCIVNREKRHAFVKMYFRKDAEQAKKAMEDSRNTAGLQLRTRWGVGFGPRPCSDYSTGISVIPINQLTEADRKWMLSAPYGGTGGQPITSGMCVEEPDIEIGKGMSSKAMSRRMQTDKSGNHGPKSSRREDDTLVTAPSGNGMAGGPNVGGNGGGGPNGGGNGGGGGRWARRGRDHRRGSDKAREGGGNHDRSTNDEPIVMGLPAGITLGPNGINFSPEAAAYGP